jgi:hypothetical protein
MLRDWHMSSVGFLKEWFYLFGHEFHPIMGLATFERHKINDFDGSHCD